MNIVNDSCLISLPTNNIPIWNEENKFGKYGSCLLKSKNINFRILHPFLDRRFDIVKSMITEYEYIITKTGITYRLGSRIKYVDQSSIKICPLRFIGNISRRDEIIIRNIVRSIEEKMEEICINEYHE